MADESEACCSLISAIRQVMVEWGVGPSTQGIALSTLLGAAQRAAERLSTKLGAFADFAHSPAICLVATLSRFQTLLERSKGLTPTAPTRCSGCGIVPDFFRHRVFAIGQPGDGLGDRQRGTLGVTEVGRFPPGRRGREALPADARPGTRLVGRTLNAPPAPLIW